MSLNIKTLEDKNSYKSITKAIGLFGGVKVFQIIISIIRSKIIAILIGPNGMGISSLLTSSTDIVSSITGCGLDTSAVRDIAKAHESGDQNRINTTVTVLRKLVFLTGMVGTVITFLLSSYLSKIAFGNYEYSTAFKIISVILLFNQLNVGQIVLLQGTFHYKLIAKSTILGNLFALILTIPFYYYIGVNGIVPAIIISSLIALCFSSYFSKKIEYKNLKISFRKIREEGKTMLMLGIVLAITGVIARLSGYLMNLIISHYGSVSDVGLYSAGYTIANSYVFIILSSMASDYVPRLSAIADDTKLLVEAMNKQAILMVTIITPMIILLMIFIKEFIILLYSTKFVPIIGMSELMMFGMLFRAISWVMSYSFIARGNSKVFFISELSICIIGIFIQYIGYCYLGFVGLGIAFILLYIIYTVQLLILNKLYCKFKFSREFWKIFLPHLLFCLLGLLIILILDFSIIRYIIGSLLLIASIIYSYKVLNARIGIMEILKNIHK